MKGKRETSPCARCPYHLGIIRTLVSPCPQCHGGGLWLAEEVLRKANERMKEREIR